MKSFLGVTMQSGDNKYKIKFKYAKNLFLLFLK
jgi:hypothetical protein